MSGGLDVAELSVICGPTAAGKSAIAHWLAEREALTIISADSRQIYRGFDIGTAKPSREEQARIPHRGVDVVDPNERYSADRWRQSADAWIDESLASRRTPVIVGGTGFYVRALIDGLFEQPPMDVPRRERLRLQLDSMSIDQLRRWVERLDPERAHLGRVQLTRAVETALLSGRRLSALQQTTRPTRWRARYLVVDPRTALASRIPERMEQMIAHGWGDEVQGLMMTVPGTAPAWNATGYAVMRRMVSGEISMDEAKRAIVIDTRQYAKRQRTWFRHQLPASHATWVDPTDPNWRDAVWAWWAGRGRASP